MRRNQLHLRIKHQLLPEPIGAEACKQLCSECAGTEKASCRNINQICNEKCSTRIVAFFSRVTRQTVRLQLMFSGWKAGNGRTIVRPKRSQVSGNPHVLKRIWNKNPFARNVVLAATRPSLIHHEKYPQTSKGSLFTKYASS